MNMNNGRWNIFNTDWLNIDSQKCEAAPYEHVALALVTQVLEHLNQTRMESDSHTDLAAQPALVSVFYVACVCVCVWPAMWPQVI